MTERTGRRRKQLLDDLKENRGYTNLKEEALDRTLGELFLKGLWTCLDTDCGTNDCMSGGIMGVGIA